MQYGYNINPLYPKSFGSMLAMHFELL